jgi:hypothetical protein
VTGWCARAYVSLPAPAHPAGYYAHEAGWRRTLTLPSPASGRGTFWSVPPGRCGVRVLLVFMRGLSLRHHLRRCARATTSTIEAPTPDEAVRRVRFRGAGFS